MSFRRSCRRGLTLCAVLVGTLATGAEISRANEPDFGKWPLLKSSFPSTGGGGITIKGYDPVISGAKCITTFMAVTSASPPEVYANVIQFDAVQVQGGTLCQNGKWRAFEGGAEGTTPFRIFFKDGVWRASAE
jgi:hypothetical protein